MLMVAQRTWTQEESVSGVMPHLILHTALTLQVADVVRSYERRSNSVSDSVNAATKAACRPRRSCYCAYCRGDLRTALHLREQQVRMPSWEAASRIVNTL